MCPEKQSSTNALQNKYVQTPPNEELHRNRAYQSYAEGLFDSRTSASFVASSGVLTCDGKNRLALHGMELHSVVLQIF